MERLEEITDESKQALENVVKDFFDYYVITEQYSFRYQGDFIPSKFLVTGIKGEDTFLMCVSSDLLFIKLMRLDFPDCFTVFRVNILNKEESHFLADVFKHLR